MRVAERLLIQYLLGLGDRRGVTGPSGFAVLLVVLRLGVLVVPVFKDETRLDRLVTLFVVLEIQGVMKIGFLVSLHHSPIKGVGSGVLCVHTRAVFERLEVRTVLLNGQEMFRQDLSRTRLA